MINKFRTKRIFSVFILLMFGCLAIPFTGCGSDSGEAGTPQADTSSAETNDEASNSASDAPISVESGSLGKAKFIKQADSICEKGRHKFEGQLSTLLENFGSSTSGSEAFASLEDSELETLVTEFFIPIHEEEIDQVAALGAPSADAAAIAAILEAIQRGLDEASARPLELTKGALTELPAFAESAKLATAYGLQQCGLT
jgi:hypothetical protein